MNDPVSLPFTFYCENCKSLTIIVLYPGHMFPISDVKKKTCLVCDHDTIKMRNHE